MASPHKKNKPKAKAKAATPLAGKVKAAPPTTGKVKAATPAAAKAKHGHSLVIVESPTKQRTIAKFLGNGYTIMATYGHIRDLPSRTLGVDESKEFEPQYVIL